MESEAAKRAKAKYRKKHGRFHIQFYATDEDIKSRLEERAASGEPKATYVKRLIREDIRKERG